MKQEITATQLEIHQAFLRLWSQLPAEKIRVKSVCDETPIARSTFYTYYDSIDDLRREIELVAVEGLLDINRKPVRQLLDGVDDLAFVASTFDYIDSHREVFQAFLVAQPNFSFIERWKKAIQRQFRPIFREQGSANQDLKLEIFSAGVVAAITYQMKRPEKSPDMEDLNRLIFKVLG